jgi:hypothetical protein
MAVTVQLVDLRAITRPQQILSWVTVKAVVEEAEAGQADPKRQPVQAVVMAAPELQAQTD